ncbi:MAG TPA: cation transporter [Gemmatimonadaceae bacterium]|nr:cation transporter [Gemmatimonadaceae bacterium]
MRIGRVFEFPEEQRRERERAKRIAWISLGLLFAASIATALTVGQSEAMKTAWVSDVLSMVPPIAYLVASHYELRAPSKRFPFGYFRAMSVCFLVTASALSIIGLWLFFDSGMKLLKGQRPPIGTVVLFGHQIWAGWTMMAALAFSLTMGMIVGKLKEPVAKKLHDKALEADSKLNRAEWMSEGAAIIGLLLVAFGHWWGDAAAAVLISLDIIQDGWLNIKQVVADLMDETPSVLGADETEDLPTRVKEAAERLVWVDQAAVRLREQGHVITGDVFVVPREMGDLVPRLEEASDELSKVDWRLHGLVVMPVARIDHESPPRV